jgi:hypothetical protein
MPGTTISATIEWVQPERVWLLVPGGRIPLVFGAVGSILIDRNVLGALSALAKNPAREDMQAEKWWLNHLNSEGCFLNPSLCAIEGPFGRSPTFPQFCSALDAARDLLSRELPRATIIKHGEAELRATYGIIERLAPRRERETSFLLSVAPRIANRMTKQVAHSIEDGLLVEAQAAGLLTGSLVLLCVLSCLYERADGAEPMIGRGILKPRPDYQPADAYNAIADLQCLEFFSAASALGAGTVGLVTRDKYLVALWCALGIKQQRLGEEGNEIIASPSPALFPGLVGDEMAELFDRVADRVAS